MVSYHLFKISYHKEKETGRWYKVYEPTVKKAYGVKIKDTLYKKYRPVGADHTFLVPYKSPRKRRQ